MEDQYLDSYWEDRNEMFDSYEEIDERWGQWDDDDDEPGDEPDGMTDVEADADTLKNCGWGTDEDYGYFGCGED